MPLLIIAMIVGYAFIVAPRFADNDDVDVQEGSSGDFDHSSTPSATPSPTKTPVRRDPAAEQTQFPEPGTVFAGVFTEAGPHNFADTDRFIEATGHSPSAHEFSAGWEEDEFNRDLFDAVAERDMLPILAWEPWDYKHDGPRHDQPDYQLRDIIDGDYDEYIKEWAVGIESLGYPIAIRFAHEMNGNWYPWSEGVNGNQPGEYVEAYRHVHDIFTEVGADDVIWIWSPNVSHIGSAPFENLYPGDDYVDWLGLVGYYENEIFDSFDKIYGDSIRNLEEISDKPIVITEIGAPNSSGRQVEWINDMFESLPRYPSVIGFVWFEVRINEDWRLAANEDGARAYAVSSQDERYDVEWTPNIYPQRRALE
ncbi:glycoside hydrolase family 26 protein [Brachybacterium epidermidis]|uniref:glycoside hydrolase family 26 protein n=1 Tax=Brachybacterium epidermidis TaxID=2781983 RepID=UPI00398F59E6